MFKSAPLTLKIVVDVPEFEITRGRKEGASRAIRSASPLDLIVRMYCGGVVGTAAGNLTFVIVEAKGGWLEDIGQYVIIRDTYNWTTAGWGEGPPFLLNIVSLMGEAKQAVTSAKRLK